MKIYNNNKKVMTTSLNVELVNEAKIYGIKNDMKLNDVIERALMELLKESGK